jgi:phage-related protein
MAFHVDENGILRPLGVTVLRDNRIDLLPGTRDYFESVPGRPGEYDFGCDLDSMLLELHCAVETTKADWPDKRATIAGYLNPLLGEQDLTFADEPGRVYKVRYAGSVSVTNFIDGREFTIPFKMCKPYRIASTQSQKIGSGTVVNGGNIETPCVVEIVGLVTNPSVVINGETMTYTGTVTASDKLVIDTERMTVTFNGANAMANYNKVFPKLAVGDNVVTAASGGTTIVRWLNRWL